MVAAACAVAALAACTPAPGPSDVAEPCGSSPASVIELGVPVLTEEEYAQFTTAGGEVWVSASGFSHGGLFEAEVGHTTVYVGALSVPPTYDAQSGELENATAQVRVIEGLWAPLRLEPGEYWIGSRGLETVSIQTCETGVVFDVVASNYSPRATPEPTASASR